MFQYVRACVAETLGNTCVFRFAVTPVCASRVSRAMRPDSPESQLRRGDFLKERHHPQIIETLRSYCPDVTRTGCAEGERKEMKFVRTRV